MAEILNSFADGAYQDFSVPGIPGIFRVIGDRPGERLDLDNFAEEHVEPNRQFLQTLCETGGYKGIAGDIKTKPNWGGGWEWEESRHPQLAKGYRLGWCVSWYTTTWGDRNPDLDIRSMDALYGEAIVDDGGVTVMESVNPNRMPVDRFYFFPYVNKLSTPSKR